MVDKPKQGISAILPAIGLGLVSVAALVSLMFWPSKPPNAGTATSERDVVVRGRTVYAANCIACHGADPQKAGTLGPDVYGSSMALLEARMLRAEYPPGYEPKRKSAAMPKLVHLKDDIPALHAFLNAPPRG